MHTMEDIAPIGPVRNANGDEVKLDKLEKRQTSVARKRRKYLRKEQLSQGVLNRLLMSLGRLTYEEVCLWSASLRLCCTSLLYVFVDLVSCHK